MQIEGTDQECDSRTKKDANSDLCMLVDACKFQCSVHRHVAKGLPDKQTAFVSSLPMDWEKSELKIVRRESRQLTSFFI